MKKFVLSLIVLSIFACKDDNGGNPSGGVRATDCRIAKEVSVEDNDTLYQTEIEYVYSGELLIKEIENYRWGSDSIVYLYNSNDQLKYVLEPRYSTRMLDTSQILEYNTAGKLSKITEIEEDTINAEFYFTHSINGPSGFFADYAHSPSERYILTTNTNGNIVGFDLVELDGQAPPHRGHAILLYDSKKNPFKGISSQELSIWEMFSNNNLTSLEYTYNDDLPTLELRIEQLQT